VLTRPTTNAGVASAARRKSRLVSTPASGSGPARRQPRARLLARRARRDDLRQQRIVVGAHLAAAIDGRLDAHVVGENRLGQQARAGLERARRILGVDARLDRRGAARRRGSAAGIGSPAATRTIHSTMSTPVTSSVTPCSTWMRVLTSRK
jgi:hypothetical protein